MPDWSPLSFVFNTLTPIFLVLALGAVLRASGFLSETFAVTLNGLIFWVALPSLLFDTISGSEFQKDCVNAAVVMLAATLVIAAIAWFGAGWMGIGPASRGSFCQSVFRSNNAYVGLPVILFATADRPDAAAILSLATLTLAPCLILYNVLAVLVLTPRQAGADGAGARVSWRRILRGIVTNPLIVSCVAGALALAAGFHPPKGIARTIESLGSLSGPGAMIALGASLTRERMRSAWRPAHLATVLKLVICPLIGWGLATLAGLNHDARFVCLVYLACPTAVASFVMAQAMKGDSALAAGAVATSTVYSCVALSVVLLLAGG
jgi:predicted permease